MKWVNASEQMPNGIRHNVKYKGNADVIYFYNNEWAFDNREGMRVFKLDWQHIEWLDESPAPEGWVSEAAKKIVENLGEYVSRLDKRGLGLPMGDEVAVMQMEHLVEQILINPDSDVEVPEY